MPQYAPHRAHRPRGGGIHAHLEHLAYRGTRYVASKGVEALVKGGVAIHNLSQDKMPSNTSYLRGSSAAAAMDIQAAGDTVGPPRGVKRSYGATPGTSTSNLSTMSSRSVGTVLANMSTHADVGAGKRGTSSKYRLHAAKYLTMDPMLKDLFFPLQRFRGFFGYMQVSGQGLNVAIPGTDNTIEKLAPRSSFRSISFFKLRHTKPRYLAGYPNESVTNQSQLLNAKRNSIGETGAVLTPEGGNSVISSYFRRFCNAPAIAIGGNGAGGVPDLGVPDFSADVSNYRQLAMDFNSADMETQALRSQQYVPYLLQTSQQAVNNGNIQTADFVNPADNSQRVPALYAGDFNNLQLAPALKDSVMRIADGRLSLDISNGSRVPTVIEVVIHSMKKCQNYQNTPDVYKTIWNANNINNAVESSWDGISNIASNVAAAPVGGWNSFWDPKTPFLKVKTSAKKQLDDIANEVHRSVHILAAGESKNVVIELGSLFYKLGGRSGLGYNNLAPENIVCKEDGPGTLAVAIGAFGVDCLETPFTDGAEMILNQVGGTAAKEGAGFWIGKTPAPSQIVVSGKYEEAFYPLYLQRPGAIMGDSASAMPSVIGDDYRSAPLGTIAPIQVTTMDGNSYLDPVGGGKAVNADQAKAS